ncbi:hypothetical protein LMBV_058 [Largemouth bass virus]|uniref:Uncharacterized protein n=1 Tax=Largemouth bass virus TaxID=176656 RepID=A0A9X7TQL8_9VIRU|nr:hypothetical protein OA88_22675 [Flavobacterium sp. JRM]QJE49121.1 hypothetical protein LMBV_058 [Largemouth bass virus]QJE49207.1 hypothetical protein LMBV_058 [Largemouth bass virus]
MNAQDIFGDISDDSSSDDEGVEEPGVIDKDAQELDYTSDQDEYSDESDDEGEEEGAQKPLDHAERPEAEDSDQDEVYERPQTEYIYIRPIDLDSYSPQELQLLPVGFLTSRFAQFTAIKTALISDFRSVRELPAVSDAYLKMVCMLILANRDKVASPYAAYNLLRYASSRGLVSGQVV